jgi:uncharacterized Tic20 family protein
MTPPYSMGPPPPGYESADDKTWALVAHFGGAAGALLGFGAGGWIAPLIALLVKGQTSATVQAHAKAALNFQIPVSAVAILLFILRACSGILSTGLWNLFDVLLWLVNVAVMLVGVIFGAVAGMRANEGSLYRYPINFQIIK